MAGPAVLFCACIAPAVWARLSGAARLGNAAGHGGPTKTSLRRETPCQLPDCHDRGQRSGPDRTLDFIAECIAIGTGYTCHPGSQGAPEPISRTATQSDDRGRLVTAA